MRDTNRSFLSQAARTVPSLIFAFVTGAALALLLAPRKGRSSRAWLRQRYDNLRSRLRRRGREMRNWQAYERGRVTGVVHDLRARMASRGPSDTVDDDIVTARVHTKFGEHHLTRHLPRLNIDTVDGVVTLRGHLPSERDCGAAERMAAEVAGVRKVINKIGCGMPETWRKQA